MKKTTAIICAYNEQNTVMDVILYASIYSIIDEIIVVNDGSTDGTKDIIDELKKEIDLKAIHLEKNKGKGNAMAIGVENASNEIIVFVDADLSNIQEKHFNQLIEPVTSGEADMVLGQPSETLIDYGINPFKSFTGQRAILKTDIEPIIDKMKTSRFGVETLINLFYQSQGKTVKHVMLKDLIHPTKFGKTSPIKATKEFIFEGHEIAMTAIKNYDLIIKSLKEITKKYI